MKGVEIRMQSDDDMVSDAMSAAGRGDHNLAISIFSRLIRTYEVSELFNQRALSYMEVGDIESALSDLDRAIQLSAKDADCLVNRGNAYLKLKRFEEAVRDFDQAIRLSPRTPQAYNGRGWALAKLGRISEGIDSLWSAFGLDNTYLSPLYNLGLVCAEAGRFDEAVSYLERAVSMCGDDESINSLLRDARNKRL